MRAGHKVLPRSRAEAEKEIDAKIAGMEQSDRLSAEARG